MDNKILNQKTLAFLEEVVPQSFLHARFLNTLSFLEYIGTRKIMKSQHSNHFNKELLEHLNEEARHSLFFKTLAEKTRGQKMGFHPEELLLKKESEDYFQKLDQKAKELSSHPFLNYLYTTWIIETRALHFYSLYNKVLKKYSSPFSLRFVLKEEEEHLKLMEEWGVNKNPVHKKHLTLFEGEEFSRLLSCWCNEVFQNKKQPPLSL